MAAAFGGVWLLLAGGEKGSMSHSSLAFVLGMLGAITYAGYLRGGKEARRHLSTAEVMLWGSLAATLILLPVGLLTEDRFLPQNLVRLGRRVWAWRWSARPSARASSTGRWRICRPPSRP